MTITGRQIREARKLLSMWHWQLAKLAGVSTSEIVLAEIGEAEPAVAQAHVVAIQRALETAGVEFISESFGGPNVRLRKST